MCVCTARAGVWNGDVWRQQHQVALDTGADTRARDRTRTQCLPHSARNVLKRRPSTSGHLGILYVASVSLRPVTAVARCHHPSVFTHPTHGVSPKVAVESLRLFLRAPEVPLLKRGPQLRKSDGGTPPFQSSPQTNTVT
jgi:hypothetical protein